MNLLRNLLEPDETDAEQAALADELVPHFRGEIAVVELLLETVLLNLAGSDAEQVRAARPLLNDVRERITQLAVTVDAALPFPDDGNAAATLRSAITGRKMEAAANLPLDLCASPANRRLGNALIDCLMEVEIVDLERGLMADGRCALLAALTGQVLEEISRAPGQAIPSTRVTNRNVKKKRERKGKHTND